ncbi:hypothetical protein HYW17_00030 [Candidatus Uhrbacteria bacterium]|nr:hypothetical protein [Candidatus Uhrbacteria bacterium]
MGEHESIEKQLIIEAANKTLKALDNVMARMGELGKGDTLGLRHGSKGGGQTPYEWINTRHIVGKVDKGELAQVQSSLHNMLGSELARADKEVHSSLQDALNALKEMEQFAVEK